MELCHSIFGNSIFTHTKVKFETFYINEFFERNNSIMRLFLSFGDRKFWRFISEHMMVCGQLFRIKQLAIQHCASVLYFLHLIGGGLSHHEWTWKIWINVMILVWESQKSKFMLHDLCISICVYWFALMPFSMLVELSYVFRGQGDYQGVCYLAMTLGWTHAQRLTFW